MQVSVEGQAIVVTGAASGVGRAVAEQAAASGAAALFLVDRDGAGLERVAGALSGPEVACHVADLAESGAAAGVATAAIARMGRIDGLVNAAALTDRATMLDGTPELWDRLMAVNARAPYQLMQGAISDMLARGAPGGVVNILSVNAHCGAPDLAIYSATKGALATLTRNAAHAHLGDRIRVNGINLGWTLTETEDRLQAEVLGKGAAWAEEAGAGLPLGRLLTPDEAARQVIYLLSPASAPMTGELLEFEQRVLGAPVPPGQRR